MTSTPDPTAALKIRPPVVFSRENADMLVDALDKSLKKVG